MCTSNKEISKHLTNLTSVHCSRNSNNFSLNCYLVFFFQPQRESYDGHIDSKYEEMWKKRIPNACNEMKKTPFQTYLFAVSLYIDHFILIQLHLYAKSEKKIWNESSPGSRGIMYAWRCAVCMYGILLEFTEIFGWIHKTCITKWNISMGKLFYLSLYSRLRVFLSFLPLSWSKCIGGRRNVQIGKTGKTITRTWKVEKREHRNGYKKKREKNIESFVRNASAVGEWVLM